jgi:hypothetical protein
MAEIDPIEFDRKLEVFFGRTSDAVAYVYARFNGVPADSSWQLSGGLTGPVCRYAETLPARSVLVDRGPGASLLAAATVPEPCFWSPEMPHLYDVEVELRHEGQVIATSRRLFGFRNLGSADGKLIYDAKRWVLRAVMASEVATSSLDEWRDSNTAMLAADPSDALCEEASRVGVLLVAESVRADRADLLRLARWPAVGIVVLSDKGSEIADSGGHNLLLAKRFASGTTIASIQGVNVAFVEMTTVDDLSARNGEMAMIASRRGGHFANVAEGRAACDTLQRDLAGQGDWSGYVV